SSSEFAGGETPRSNTVRVALAPQIRQLMFQPVGQLPANIPRARSQRSIAPDSSKEAAGWPLAGREWAVPRAALREPRPQVSDTISLAERLRQLIGMMKERTPGFWSICGFSPDSTLGTEITKSRPKSRLALPEMVLATSPTRSFMVSWLKSFSCIFISSTVSIALGAVKYTTPSRFPEMLMTPVYSCTAGEPSIR